MYNNTKKVKSMNNYNIKNLLQAMRSTAVAALVSIGFMACSDDTFMTQNATAPVNGNGYKISIPANIGGGGTRAVSYNSETGGYDAAFETSDFIYVYNVTKDTESMKINADGWANTTYLYPDANAKKANLIGNLGFCRWDDETSSWTEIAPEVGDELLLYYKNSGRFIYYSNRSGEVIKDYALAKVTIESINDGVIITSTASFVHPQSLYKINFTNMGSGVKINKVSIESEKNNLVNCYYPTSIQWPHEFGSVSYNYDEGTDPNDLIFMLRFANNPDNYDSGYDDNITFRAFADDGHCYVGTKHVTNELVDGKYYQADIAMTDAGLAMTMTNNTTGDLVELYEAISINTKNADYTAANYGNDVTIEWYGGENTLTFKNLTLRNQGNVIRVFTDQNDMENTKDHHLILDGVNTLCSIGGFDNFNIDRNSSINISGLSGSQLIIEKGGMHVFTDATMTIESGEIIVNSLLGIGQNSTLKVEGGVLTTNRLESWHETSRCIISKDGKVRIASDSYVREGLIKAAEGYALMVSREGEYITYTVTEDDGSGLAKSITMTPTATLGYYRDHKGSKSSGDYRLNVVVMPENTKDKSLTFKTSNPNVVEIEDVKDNYVYIRPTGVGVATVTATTTDGSNLSAECVVTVKPLCGIWYQNYDVKASLGSLPFINPLTIEGNGVTNITYTSSDESVATVNASTGEVTIAAGATVGQTATITAVATFTDDGEYYYGGWNEASYTVTVVSVAGQGKREDYESDTW